MTSLVPFLLSIGLSCFPALAAANPAPGSPGAGAPLNLSIVKTPASSGVLQRVVPTEGLVDSEANRAAAADRYIAAIMDSPVRNEIIMSLLPAGGDAPEQAAGPALEALDWAVFKAHMKVVLLRHFTTDELSTGADNIRSRSYPVVFRKVKSFDADLKRTLAMDMAKLVKTPDPGEGAFRLGLVAPLTGEAASFGVAGRKGAELAVKEWNARGGVLGRPVRLIAGDDRGDPAAGAVTFNQLIQKEKVSAIVGAVMSKVSLAGAPLCQAARVPMLSPTSTNPRVTAVGDYIFRACFIDPYQGTVGAKFAFEQLRARKAACLFDVGNDYTKGLSTFFKAKFIAMGGEITGYEGHATGTTDFKPQLAAMLSARPDLLYVSDYYNDVALIARQARALGFLGPILGGDGWDSPKYVEAGGAATENTYYTNHYTMDDPGPEVRAFQARYSSQGLDRPDALAALYYDAANLMLEAVRRAGSTDGRAIRDALQATDTDTVCGKIRFGADRNPIKSAVIIRIRHGRQEYFTRIDP